ncbi:GL12418 [Drosophila persimilis]|uniref:Secernin-2 n=2 Tax=pseudoobscura subgroup TaxID=32358 RepID=A0A6I8URX3_DROPS|nr:secernin-2 [Drosophila pseudoobscura]XP_002019481.1 secernin-2 [Drosophila persimilis]EDW38115.1 GL12418 [Drosophila persimilis]
MSSNGECFVVLPANCVSGTLIVGRNAEDEASVGVAEEVCYYDVSDVIGEGKTDGGAAAESSNEDALRVILQKPKPGLWGGDFGANERGVAVGLTWTDGEEDAKDNDSLLGTDIVRLTLAVSSDVEAAVDRIGLLVATHGHDKTKLNFIACDSTAAWLISCAGKVWAAEKVESSFLRLPSGGLTVTTTINKSSEGLDAEASFAAAHDAEAQPPAEDWCGPKPSGDGTYTQHDMFETLRAASNESSSRAATVSVLSAKGICCHWFTATPNAAESVFKPFVFAPKPRISPLTAVQSEAELTLLHKLHSQRKPAALEHLRSLERSCVDELNNYFSLQDHASDELDELLKDCVEAEVKFYR